MQGDGGGGRDVHPSASELGSASKTSGSSLLGPQPGLAADRNNISSLPHVSQPLPLVSARGPQAVALGYRALLEGSSFCNLASALPRPLYLVSDKPCLAFGKLTVALNLLLYAFLGVLSTGCHPVCKGSALGGYPKTPWGFSSLPQGAWRGTHSPEPSLSFPLSCSLSLRQQGCLLKEVRTAPTPGSWEFEGTSSRMYRGMAEWPPVPSPRALGEAVEQGS